MTKGRSSLAASIPAISAASSMPSSNPMSCISGFRITHRSRPSLLHPPLLLLLLPLLLGIALTISCDAARMLPPPQDQASLLLPPTYVFAFGDSITDTGNSPIANSTLAGMVANLPFGMTWFGHGSNRWSDGRLIIDWLCFRAYGACAPHRGLLPPHLAELAAGLQEGSDKSSAMRSQNYAVAGATALSPDALKQAADVDTITPDSLDVQVGWFEHDVSAARARGGISAGTTLIHLGEIGGDDVNYALRDRMSPLEIRERIVPRVVSTVASQLERILSVDLGPAPITRVVIQGQFPMGCMPVYVLQANSSSSSGAGFPSGLDRWGCVAAVSAISDLQNELIRSRIIPAAAAKHPRVSFAFLDTSAAYRHILAHAQEFGFSNLNDRMCDINTYILFGTLSSTEPNNQFCSDPSTYVSWDGIHLTDAMAGALVQLFLQGQQGQEQPFSHPFPSFLTELVASSA